MGNYEKLHEILKNMDTIAKALDVDPFPIYFLGSACILGRYSNHFTRDFDFVDLNYPAKTGKVLRYLSDYDMLEYESTLLSPSYKQRALRLEAYDHLQIYILAREDIVVSKIIRMEQKDIEDMDILMADCNMEVIRSIIQQILDRKDLFDNKKDAFIKNLPGFRERYHV